MASSAIRTCSARRSASEYIARALDIHFPAGPDDPDCNLPPIGDQDFLDTVSPFSQYAFVPAERTSAHLELIRFEPQTAC